VCIFDISPLAAFYPEGKALEPIGIGFSAGKSSYLHILEQLLQEESHRKENGFIQKDKVFQGLNLKGPANEASPFTY
jgi:hypothetical protein